MGTLQRIFFCLTIAVVFVSAQDYPPEYYNIPTTTESNSGYENVPTTTESIVGHGYVPMPVESTPAYDSVTTTTESPYVNYKTIRPYPGTPEIITETPPDIITETPPDIVTESNLETPIESTLISCPLNEVPSKCGNCRKTCSIRERDPDCLCVPGCICDIGYLRNIEGVCVPENMCDAPCNGDLGRVFDPCGNSCERTCSNIKDPLWECTPTCVDGGACKCREGLVENKGGHCVRPEDCDLTCDPNEAYSECMGNIYCQDSCMEPKNRLYCPYPFCKAGCACTHSYVRDDNGVCIPFESCLESCNGDTNARRTTCTPCQPPTCANVNDETIYCAAFCDNIEGCICKDGYAGHEGKCIPIRDCPKCSGLNELYLCRGCDLTVGEVINQNCTERFPCKEGCYCKSGYARDLDGSCVKLAQSGQTSCNDDPNAYFDQCDLNCEKTCEEKDGPKSCVLGMCSLQGKCLCRDGFVKNSEGKCILPEMCDYVPRSTLSVTCGPNENYEHFPQSCTPEDNTCELYLSGKQQVCTYGGEACSPGCRCAPGYMRNRSGACVMPHECCEDPNSELVSGPNTCPGGTCGCPEFEQCDNPWVPFGCQCKSGFLKISNTNPTCVPASDCCYFV